MQPEQRGDMERRLQVLEDRPNGGSYKILTLRVDQLQKAVDSINVKIWSGLAVLAAVVGSILTILLQKVLS